MVTCRGWKAWMEAEDIFRGCSQGGSTPSLDEKLISIFSPLNLNFPLEKILATHMDFLAPPFPKILSIPIHLSIPDIMHKKIHFCSDKNFLSHFHFLLFSPQTCIILGKQLKKNTHTLDGGALMKNFPAT